MALLWFCFFLHAEGGNKEKKMVILLKLHFFLNLDTTDFSNLYLVMFTVFFYFNVTTKEKYSKTKKKAKHKKINKYGLDF